MCRASASAPRSPEGALDEAGAARYVIALDADGFDASGFSGMVDSSGGTMTVTDDPESIGDHLLSLRELTQLAVTSYESSADRGIQDLVMTVGDTSILGSYITGGDQVGYQRLQPRPGIEPSGPSFLRTELGKTVGFLSVRWPLILFTFGWSPSSSRRTRGFITGPASLLRRLRGRGGAG